MNYALGYSFNIKELFERFNWKKLSFNCLDALNVNNSLNRLLLAYAIFKTHLEEVLEDVVENNITFQLPTGARPAEIRMKTESGELFKTARQRGAFKEIDFLSSFFKAHRLALFMYGSGRTRIKNIYVTKYLKNKIIQKTNEGFNYG